MVDKFVEPIGFPLLVLGLFWLSERNKNPDRKANREKMRFWVGVAILIACGELAVAWHNEIGSAWQNHPEFTLFATLVIFMVFNAVAPPLPGLLNDEPRQHAAKKVP